MAYESQELITIQAGSLANRIGTHFWNLQEAQFVNQSAQHLSESPFIKHALFDTSSSANSARPRLLAIDLKQVVNFGLDFNFEDNAFQNIYPSWNGSVNRVVRTSSNSQNSNLDTNQASDNWLNCLSHSTLKCWKEDGILLSLPVSMETIPNSVGNQNAFSDRSTMLSSFIQGEELMYPGGFAFDEFEERIRHLAERCSRPSGFQLVVNAEDGFGGLGSKIIEYLSEEYGKRSILCMPIYNTSLISQMDLRHQLLAQSNELALVNVLESANAFSTHLAWLPMDISAVNSDTMHSCAIAGVLAASLDTVTTPVRLNGYDGGFSLDDFIRLAYEENPTKMFSMQSGVTPSSPDALNWFAWNPYIQKYQHDMANSQPSASSRRRIFCRGLPSTQSSLILEYASDEANSSHSNNPLFRNLHLPSMDSGSSIRLASSLPNYPLKTLRPSGNPPIVPVCQQLPQLSMAAILDCPTSNSLEMLGLSDMVNRLSTSCRRPPDLKMEQDMWIELLEFGRTRFMETCNYGHRRHVQT